MTLVLDVQGCNVSIREEQILTNIDFQVRQGEIMALVGHNGAGKSTLIKSMIGAREKSTGQIKIANFDQDLHFVSYKKSFTYIPEEPLLFSELTVAHHFRMYQKSYSIKEDMFSNRVDHYVKAFELSGKLDEYPESLSKGMRQKVQTICALLPDVPIMFIDEPFMGLDVYAGTFLEKALRKKREEGVSIVLTTHQLDKVKSLADRYVMLANGMVSSSGEVAAFEELERRFT